MLDSLQNTDKVLGTRFNSLDCADPGSGMYTTNNIILSNNKMIKNYDRLPLFHNRSKSQHIVEKDGIIFPHKRFKSIYQNMFNKF